MWWQVLPVSVVQIEKELDRSVATLCHTECGQSTSSSVLRKTPPRVNIHMLAIFLAA